jgi:hypothetical protein
MAPELFILIVTNGEVNPEMPSTTKSSDVYSFALLALEVCLAFDETLITGTYSIDSDFRVS